MEGELEQRGVKGEERTKMRIVCLGSLEEFVKVGVYYRLSSVPLFLKD